MIKILGLILLIPFVIVMCDLLIDAIRMSNAAEKVLLFTTILFAIGVGITANAETFKYKTGLTIEAPDYKTAAKLCFKKLNPVYVSDEKALDVIDICVNGKVK